MKIIAFQILTELVKRFITADNIKKLSKELTDRLFDFVIMALKKDGITPVEQLLIDVITEIRK